MKSLKDLLLEYENFEDDITIIKLYLSQDEITEIVPQLLTLLLKDKIREQTRFINYVKGNACMPTDYYYTNYSHKIAGKLDLLTRKMQLNIPFDESDIDWMKSFELPPRGNSECFWSDLYSVIEYYQGKIKDKPQFFGYYRCELNND